MKFVVQVATIVLSFSLLVNVSSASQSESGLIKKAKSSLVQASQKFYALKDSGMINYKVEIDKQRYASKLKLIDDAVYMLMAGEPKGEYDYATTHENASEAIIGIRGLKTAGSIGIVKKEARELYTAGYVALKDAVLSLYELKSNFQTAKAKTLAPAQPVEIMTIQKEQIRSSLKMVQDARRGFLSMLLHKEVTFTADWAKQSFQYNIDRMDEAADELETALIWFTNPESYVDNARRLLQKVRNDLRTQHTSGQVEFVTTGGLPNWRRNIFMLEDAITAIQ